jgi:hypothetical protein
MQVRHLVIAALLVTAGAAQAEGIRPHAGTLTGWAVQGKVVGASTVAVQASPAIAAIPAFGTPAAAPVAAAPGVTAAAVGEVPEPSSIALLLAGAMGVGALRRRRK